MPLRIRKQLQRMLEIGSQVGAPTRRKKCIRNPKETYFDWARSMRVRKKSTSNKRPILTPFAPLATAYSDQHKYDNGTKEIIINLHAEAKTLEQTLRDNLNDGKRESTAISCKNLRRRITKR